MGEAFRPSSMRDFKIHLLVGGGLLVVLASSVMGEGYWYEGSSQQSSSSSSSDTSADLTLTHQMDLTAEGDAVNHPGIDATSKACRYDAPEWTDCDPFELVRFRVLRLIHGGSQCEEVKNITRHCTPHEFPYGTHWLIQEHRKCISELNRLKAMISDLHKFIEVLHGKGKELFDAYMKLKSKLDELKQALDKLKLDYAHKQEILEKLKADIEEWKSKARELQIQLDELKAKYHDLQSEQQELKLKNSQCKRDVDTVVKENEGIQGKIDQFTHENEELKRRIVESEHIQEQVREKATEKLKFEARLEKRQDKLQTLKDTLADCRLANLAAQVPSDAGDEIDTKDTHVELSMEMFIVHNRTNLYKPTAKTIYFTTKKPYTTQAPPQPKCLISYYGVTNETCWYESEGEKSEDSYVDALGHHLVEAHWKYFTINVKDAYECDKASHLHYEFLLHRCSPKHFLPVPSVYRPDADAKELGTHIYPKPQGGTGKNNCWITFLGAHGHCEAHNEKFDLYNTDDTNEGYNQGSGSSKAKCFARAEWWQNYCQTPVVVTYVPDGVSTNFEMNWIMHDSHGGRMFEETEDTKQVINPDSLNPHSPINPPYPSQYKSMEPKSPDYHDSPEYRKSLHLEGKEKEAILAQLRARLGMTGKAGAVSTSILNHGGVDTSANVDIGSDSGSSSSYSSISSSGYGSSSGYSSGSGSGSSSGSGSGSGYGSSSGYSSGSGSGSGSGTSSGFISGSGSGISSGFSSGSGTSSGFSSGSGSGSSSGFSSGSSSSYRSYSSSSSSDSGSSSNYGSSGSNSYSVASEAPATEAPATEAPSSYAPYSEAAATTVAVTYVPPAEETTAAYK